MRRRILLTDNSPSYKGMMGDIFAFNRQTGKKEIISRDIPIESIDTETYEPIGIVVIPGNHNVYGTGECGIMALLSASLSTPDVGSVTTNTIGDSVMMWGQYGVQDIPDICQWYVEAVMQGMMDKDIIETITGSASRFCIPLMQDDLDKGVECLTEPGLFYTNITSNGYGYAPSPYAHGEMRNALYHIPTTNIKSNNILANFASRELNDVMLQYITEQADWQTAKTITEKSARGYCNPIASCWRFMTSGTEHGDWYCPTSGELGYLCVRYDKINSIIDRLQSHFGQTYCPLIKSSYWSCERHAGTASRIIYFSTGEGNWGVNNGRCRVRPFTRFRAA